MPTEIAALKSLRQSFVVTFAVGGAALGMVAIHSPLNENSPSTPHRTVQMQFELASCTPDGSFCLPGRTKRACGFDNVTQQSVCASKRYNGLDHIPDNWKDLLPSECAPDKVCTDGTARIYGPPDSPVLIYVPPAP
jgi:hypothetical protein